MASSTTKLMARSSSRRMAIPPCVAGQMDKSLCRLNKTIITPNSTARSGPHTMGHMIDGEGTAFEPKAIMRVLIPISIAGWLLFGVICILCINGKGKLGRWVPKWYLDSQATKRDKALVMLWWIAVMVLWPVILPVLLLRKVIRVVKHFLVGGKKDARMLQPKQGVEEV
ncbi:hypothetical protein H0G86_003268 [Trichoderma simmonsii]|uniref:Uncharacterized protein n=1 Tax=Trichoderma simmonsii TaxID=1491479 RepID=A0A8G0L9Y0_9HYPO|nr:hypothetical protein H0G86_003268 [Trichoderma simmonsii]